MSQPVTSAPAAVAPTAPAAPAPPTAQPTASDPSAPSPEALIPATPPQAAAPLSAPSPEVPVTSTPEGHFPEAPDPQQLLDFVRRAATDAELVASLPLDPEERTWLRLEGPGGSEAWLIGWPPGTGTGWHDHAESFGAFIAASGELTENSLAVRLPTDGWKTLELAEGVDRHRTIAAGKGRFFGQQHVHEVLNETAEHAISVHAYYPPLPHLRRYSRSGPVLRLEQVERPEDWQ